MNIPSSAMLRCANRNQCYRLRRLPPLQVGVQQARSFFGLGEILGVITNPAETIRQLHESKNLLQKAKEERDLQKEVSKIPTKHTFSRLPGFHGRTAEKALLNKILHNDPTMNVVFGATSVGKTALLREVLATDDFFVIKFDLRISGFADLRSLYLALCEQFEVFFSEIGRESEAMDKLRLTFKHLAIDMSEKGPGDDYKVSVADIAALMESLQSCLLQYWEFDPAAEDSQEKQTEKSSNKGHNEPRRRSSNSTEVHEDDDHGLGKKVISEDESIGPAFKKKPLVFFIDEAHKLPALVGDNDQLSLKVFLDTLLVLTKQDRLCHVVLATSDSFFQHFLRAMNVGQHCQVMTVGDCTKEETREFFEKELLVAVPDELKSRFDFEEAYAAFGGKLSHLGDYTRSWINADGELSPYMSSIFTQAYTLLQFHLTHQDIETFSPLTAATAGTKGGTDEETGFSRDDLLYVMRRLVRPPYSLPYFDLCNKIGTSHADGMIKTRILELRWTKTISPEDSWVERKWSEDGIERPILLPMTRIVRRAMEVVLDEEERKRTTQLVQDSEVTPNS